MPTNWTIWKKWINYWKKYNLPKLNQKESKDLKRPVANKEIKAVIKEKKEKKRKPPKKQKS